MSYSVYIIYSQTIDKYYIGETENIKVRLELHNNGHFSNSYTSKVKDWRLIHSINCENRVQARKIEAHIKSMKSRKYLQNLSKYPEITEKLLNKFTSIGSSR